MPVSNFFIIKILSKIRSLGIYDEDDIDMMRYSLQAILWEIEKVIIIFILFTLMSRQDYFLVTLIALISIRVNAGGYHSKSSLGCLFFTFLMFLMSIIVLPLLRLNSMDILIISGFSLAATLIAAPVCSFERQAIQKNTNDGNKKIISFVVTFIWLALVFRFKENTYSRSVLWMIFLQNAQLLFEYFRRRYKKCLRDPC